MEGVEGEQGHEEEEKQQEEKQQQEEEERGKGSREGKGGEGPGRTRASRMRAMWTSPRSREPLPSTTARSSSSSVVEGHSPRSSGKEVQKLQTIATSGATVSIAVAKAFLRLISVGGKGGRTISMPSPSGPPVSLP